MDAHASMSVPSTEKCSSLMSRFVRACSTTPSKNWAGDEPRIDSFDHIETGLSIPLRNGRDRFLQQAPRTIQWRMLTTG